MEDLAKKASAILVVYLFVSLEFGYPFLSFRDVSAQAHDSYEEFLRKLGDYFEEAAPPESAPIDECEYTIPEGLDPYVAERIWKELGALVSLGRPPEDLSNYLKEKNFTLLSLKVNGTEAKLNFSGLSVVRGEDGSVRVKVPVVSNETLDYMSYNSTDVRKLYRVWNETSLRYYRVSRISGYTLTYLDLESGESYSVNSELAVSEFPRGGLMDLLPAERLEVEELNWGTIAKSSGTPVIAVPGHYEEVKVVVPEQRANFKVLFPAYDPAVYEGWLINTAISSTSVTAGQSFTVSYSAYPEGVDPEQVPLQARVSVSVPSAIQLIGSGSAQLDNSHRSGSFSLKALRAGTYDVTLRVEGNALFYSLPPSGEIRYTVQVTTPTSPSVSVSITDVDTSVPKYARLKVKLQNNGGSAARSLTLKVSGDVEEASWSVGDLAPGQSSERELNVKLKEQEADIAIEASYLDDGGNRFLSKAWRQVFSLHFVVPEHYEDYVVTIPEHEETTTVFVPGYEGYTHVRFYAAYSFAVGNPNIYGPTAALFFPGIVLDVPTLFYEFFGTKITRGETLSLLRTYLIPLPLPGLELSVSKDGNFSQPEGVDVNFMLTGVEPRWEEVGLLEEGEAARAGNLTREQIRSGDTPDTFRAEFVKEVWVPSRKAVMNLSEFVKFRFAMESYIAENSLANELRYRWEEFVNATRIYAKSKEGGFAVFVYHPLTVRGSGALKSVQVKNYAACNASYELRVVRRSMPAAGFGVPALEEVMNTTSIEVPGTGDLSLFASSLAREGYQLRAQLVYGCRVVAEVVFDLQPELSPFWAGFWDGVKEKLPGIIITTTILVVLAIPTGGGSILAEVKALLTSSVIPTLIGASVAAEVMELVDAYWAYERMGKVAEELDEFSRRATENGYAESSSLFRGLGDRVREDRLLIAESTALDLLADLTARDLFVVFGREDTTEYERGKAWGRVVGVALSFMLYAGTYYKLFAEGPKLLSWKGKIKEFLRGVYNWITPPIFDVGVMMGKFAAHEVAASLAMSERSEEFREQLNLLRDEEDSLSSLVRYTGDYLDKALEISETLGLSERAFLGLLWAYGNTVRELGKGDWEGFIENVRSIGRDSKRFADEYLRWVYNAEVSELDEIILETTPKLAGLSAEELENIGKALAAKGLGDSFENGLKLFNTYFKTAGLEQYGKGVANAFVEAVSKNVEILDIWSRTVADELPIYFGKAPSTCLVPTPEDQSKIQGKVVYVYVLDQYTKDIVAEGSRKVKPEGQKDFKFGKSDIKSGDELLILISKFTVEDFYNKYDVKNNIIIEGENAYYKDVNGRVLKQLGPGILDGYLDETHIDYLFKDLTGRASLEDAPELRLRISDSGYQMLIDSSGERNAIKSVELKSVKDDSGNLIAELLFARTPEGPLRGEYLLSRNLPQGWLWCLSNEENAAELKSDQVKLTIDDLLWRILDPGTYDKLKTGLDDDAVRIAAVFETQAGKRTKWTGGPGMSFIVPEGATGVSRFYIAWADEFEHALGDTTFKLSPEEITIKGPEGDTTFKTGYKFKTPVEEKVALVLDLPYDDNYKLAFVMNVDNDGKLKIETELRNVYDGETKQSWKITNCEYQQTYYITKGDHIDKVLVLYEEDGGKEIIGLTQSLPKDIIGKPEHAVAVMHAEDYIINRMGGKIKKCEVGDKQVDRIIDIVAEIKDEKVIVEVKRGIEKSLDENTIKQPEKDRLLLLGKGEEKYDKAYYFFEEEPSGEGAKEYLKIIRQTYEKYPELAGRVFVIIGENGNLVSPTDPSLDFYVNP